jgi:hypothetical protein
MSVSSGILKNADSCGARTKISAPQHSYQCGADSDFAEDLRKAHHHHRGCDHAEVVRGDVTRQYRQHHNIEQSLATSAQEEPEEALQRTLGQ